MWKWGRRRQEGLQGFCFGDWNSQIAVNSYEYGFPCSSVGKESACNAGNPSSIPGLGRSPGEGKGYPFQYSGPEKSMDCIVHGVAKSRTLLNDFHFLSFHMNIQQWAKTDNAISFMEFIYCWKIYILWRIHWHMYRIFLRNWKERAWDSRVRQRHHSLTFSPLFLEPIHVSYIILKNFYRSTIYMCVYIYTHTEIYAYTLNLLYFRTGHCYVTSIQNQ